MNRTFSIFGRRLTFESAEGDEYLASIPESLDSGVRAIFPGLIRTDSTVIDVGANVGITAAYASLLCPAGRVFAIEASPTTFSHLQRNIEANRLANVKALNCAVSAEDGEVEIKHKQDFSAGGFVSDVYGVGDPSLMHERVKARRLDDIARSSGMPSIDFLKIDVEGAELDVLKGAAGILSADRPTVFLEVNHWCLNVFARTSIVDFLQTILSTFPHVYAIDVGLDFIDLGSEVDRYRFFYEHVVKSRYNDLVCGFDLDQLSPALSLLKDHAELRKEIDGLRRERDQIRAESDRLRAETDRLRAEKSGVEADRDAVYRSRSWRITAPLRRFSEFLRSPSRREPGDKSGA